MKKIQKSLYTAIIVSETSHVFCCVLPTIFSVLSLLAGLGMVTVVPLWLQNIHETLHDWEVPLIVTSGVVVALGWALHSYSNKIDCHDTGCKHGPCGPAKKKTHVILQVATVLFLINVSVYLVLHRGMEIFVPDNAAMHEQVQHKSHDH